MIKGSLSRPHRDAARKGYLPMKIPSDADDHFMYSIQSGNSTSYAAASSSQSSRLSVAQVDYRIHFLLNHGSLSYPSKLFIMKPHSFEKTCMEACSLYLSDAIRVDLRRWSLVVPRVCDIYRSDFGEGNVSIVEACRKLADYKSKKDIQDVITIAKQASSVVLKFDKYVCESRKNLEVIDSI